MTTLLESAATTPPSGSSLTDLTHFVDESELEALDEYLLTHVASLQSGGGGKLSLPEGEVGVFHAEGGKYGDAVELCTRDTSTWCADVFAAYSGADDFKQCRAHRGDPATWRPNYNGRVVLPGVLDFAKRLPFFGGRVGKVALIVNAPGSSGIEHVDHRMDELVSEFVWVRTKSSAKRFYVRHPATNQKHFAGETGGARDSGNDGGGSACVCWFDDHLSHCLEAQDGDGAGPQFSLRIDGRFTPQFREHIAAVGTFGKQRVCTEGGLAGILRAAAEGPRFLLEENPNEPGDSDEEGGGEEEEEVEVNGEEAEQE